MISVKTGFSENTCTGEEINVVINDPDCTKALCPVWQKKKGLQMSNPAAAVWSALITRVWLCCMIKSSSSLHGTADNTKITRDNMTDNSFIIIR